MGNNYPITLQQKRDIVNRLNALKKKYKLKWYQIENFLGISSVALVALRSNRAGISQKTMMAFEGLERRLKESGIEAEELKTVPR